MYARGGSSASAVLTLALATNLQDGREGSPDFLPSVADSQAGAYLARKPFRLPMRCLTVRSAKRNPVFFMAAFLFQIHCDHPEEVKDL